MIILKNKFQSGACSENFQIYLYSRDPPKNKIVHTVKIEFLRFLWNHWRFETSRKGIHMWNWLRALKNYNRNDPTQWPASDKGPWYGHRVLPNFVQRYKRKGNLLIRASPDKIYFSEIIKYLVYIINILTAN